jgi:hypothetical protein
MPHVVRYRLPAPARRVAAARWFALAALAVAATVATADDIYKCVDASGRITYQSAACSNGRAIDIAPGSYDPQAAARLRDDAAAWNAREDMRRVAAAHDDAARASAAAAEADARRAEAAASARADAVDCAYCGNEDLYLLPYPAWTPQRPHPPRPNPPRPRPPPPAKPPSFIVVR